MNNTVGIASGYNLRSEINQKMEGVQVNKVDCQLEIDRLICQIRERVEYCHNTSVRLKDRLNPMCLSEPPKDRVEAMPESRTPLGNILTNISEQVAWVTMNIESILERIQL